MSGSPSKYICVVRLPALSEPEELSFPRPVGRCEAFTVAGGTSTLCSSFETRLGELDFKLLSRPGELAGLRALPAVLLDQAHGADAFLQALDLQTDRRLGQEQGLGGGRERAAVGDLDEGLKGGDFHYSYRE